MRTSYCPIAAWAACGALRSAGTELDGHAHRDLERVTETELRGLGADLLATELESQRAERRVARDLERVDEGRLVAWPAGPAVLVGQVGARQREVELRRPGHGGVLVADDAVLEGGGRRDDLEGRPRRVDAVDGAVEVGLVLVGGQGLPGLGGPLQVVARERVGVVGGWLTMARIAPVFGSRATTAPLLAPSAWSAAACALGSIVSSIVAPDVLRPVMRSVTRRTKSVSASPESRSSAACSRP